MTRGACWTMAILHALSMSAAAQELIAHRGLSARAPENSLAAFKLAWQENIDACELDLHLSSDGQIVVLHDKDTLRTCGVKHLVAATPASLLTSLDVGSWKAPQWSGERLPTLDQALATLPEGTQRFVLEIKCGPEVVPPLQRTLEPLRANRGHQFVIISFNADVCAEAKKSMPWIPVYQLASWKRKGSDQPTDLNELIERAKRDGIEGLSLGKDWPWSPELVKTVRDAELGLYVWTVNDPKLAVQLARLGVDGITSDDPTALRQALTKP